MKKRVLFVTMVCIMMTGCSTGVSQGQYESVSAAASMEASEKESISSELKSVQADYSAYKESMKEYEGFTKEQAGYGATAVGY